MTDSVKCEFGLLGNRERTTQRPSLVKHETRKPFL